MKPLEKRFLLSALTLASCFSLPALGQTATRTSLGLYGGTVLDLATDSAGAVFLGAVNGPNGAYSSLDSGNTWSSAAGGAYTGGAGSYVAIVGSTAFLTTQNPSQLLMAPLPSSGATSWSPNWNIVAGATNQPAILRVQNSVLYAASGQGGASVLVVDPTTGAVTQTTTVSSTGTAVTDLRVSATTAYAVVASGPSTRLLSASVNATDGTLGTWGDITANLPGSAVPSRVFTAGTNKLYVATQGGSAPIYLSTDGGSTFTTTTATGGARSGCANADGSIISLGSNLSVDSGATWNPLSMVGNGSSGTIRLEDDGRNGICLFNPANKKQLFKRTTRGLARSDDVSFPSTSVWSELYSGIEGVTTYSMGQNLSNKNRVCLGSNSGISVTDNFSTGSPPTWTFICPGGDCVGGRNVVMSPSDSNRCLVGSGAIYAIDIATTGSGIGLTSSNFIAKPQDRFVYTSLLWPSFSPDTIIASFTNDQSNDGGLYYFNATTRSQQSVAFSGKPVSAFLPISATLHYAGLGGMTEASPSSATRGLYQSNNGGASYALVTDPVLAADPLLLINRFTYDSNADILYALSAGHGSVSGKVFRLSAASTGTKTWEEASSLFPAAPSGGGFSLSVAAVDPATGTVYVGNAQQVWESSDAGDTWVTTFTARPGETISLLYFDALNSGTNTGLQAVIKKPSGTPTPAITPLPTIPPGITPLPPRTRNPRCSIAAACVRKFCTFTVRSTLASTRGSLEQRALDGGIWSKLKGFLTGKTGKGTVSALAATRGQYRVKLKGKTKSCTTGSVTVP